jgi:hypothetical protein
MFACRLAYCEEMSGTSFDLHMIALLCF